MIAAAELQRRNFQPHLFVSDIVRKYESLDPDTGNTLCRKKSGIILMGVNIRISAECLRRGRTIYTYYRWQDFALCIPPSHYRCAAL